jgi:hypothetical protein
MEHGLALWERYTRSALSNLNGLAVLVVGYEALLADAPDSLAQAYAWLALDGVSVLPGRLDRAASFVQEGLRHRPEGDGQSGHLLRATSEQEQLH